jgi:hypothetical protein
MADQRRVTAVYLPCGRPPPACPVGNRTKGVRNAWPLRRQPWPGSERGRRVHPPVSISA